MVNPYCIINKLLRNLLYTVLSGQPDRINTGNKPTISPYFRIYKIQANH